jgi:hypothetical protein
MASTRVIIDVSVNCNSWWCGIICRNIYWVSQSFLFFFVILNLVNPRFKITRSWRTIDVTSDNLLLLQKKHAAQSYNLPWSFGTSNKQQNGLSSNLKKRIVFVVTKLFINREIINDNRKGCWRQHLREHIHN